ncbi:MAG TPA: oligoendopeptidase F, partial [Candidatus Omnitrophota bacterium]|nr:oligoendopeptidase F [Candidatus Omnitrophota bacterium]
MTHTASASLGNLPEWDLTDLYPAPDSAKLSQDLDAADAAAKSFHAKYNGRLADVSGDELGEAIAEYERISEIIYRAMSYAQLHYAGNQTDPERGQFYQGMQERVTDISTHTL